MPKKNLAVPSTISLRKRWKKKVQKLFPESTFCWIGGVLHISVHEDCSGQPIFKPAYVPIFEVPKLPKEGHSAIGINAEPPPKPKASSLYYSGAYHTPAYMRKMY